MHPRCRCAIIYDEVAEPRVNKPNSNYRQITPELTYKPVSEERYNQLIIPLKKMGVTIMRGDPDTERRLKMFGAQAITTGTSVVSFAKQVSLSAILEETYHIIQNRQGLNDDKDITLRTILNEIDAKEHLLKESNKYKIPREEIEETKMQLEEYKRALSEYLESNGDWNGENN